MANVKLIKYGHEYCQPCRLIAPILTEISIEFKDQITVKDENTYTMEPLELVAANIRAVPTIILKKDDVEVWRHVGLTTKETLISKIKELL